MSTFSQEASKVIFEEWGRDVRNGMRLFVHPITQQCFQWVPLDSKTDLSLVQRCVYSLPHTPRVIILGEVALIEEGALSLRDLLKGRMMIETLQMLYKISKAIKGLYRQYGAFRLKEDMIKGTKSGEILVWHSKSFSGNFPDQILTSSTQAEETAIIGAFNIIQKISKLPLMTHFQGLDSSSFQHFQDGLQGLIRELKEEKTRKMRKFTNETLPSEHSLSPTRVFKRQTTFRKVPEFVKNLKPKTNFVDRRSHKPCEIDSNPNLMSNRGSVPVHLPAQKIGLIHRKGSECLGLINPPVMQQEMASYLPLSRQRSDPFMNLRALSLDKQLMKSTEDIMDEKDLENCEGITQSVIRSDLDKLFTKPTTPVDFEQTPDFTQLSSEVQEILFL